MHKLISKLVVAVLACTFFAVAVPATPAFAQNNDEARKAKSKDLYRQATAQYNLGNFEGAVKLYTEAYLAWPAPVLLFNIAQAHRLNGNCGQAIFSYERYLAVEKNVPNRRQIERLIKRLEVDCKREAETRSKPPVETIPPNEMGPDSSTDTTATTTGGDTGYETAPPDTETAPKTKEGKEVASAAFTNPESGSGTAVVSEGPILEGPQQPPGDSKIALMAQFGPAFASFGALDGTTMFSGRIGGAYLLPAGPVDLELGGTLTFTPVPFEARDGSAKTGMFMGVLANAGATYPIWNKLSARGELGFGLMILQGLTEAGSIFVMDNFGATGPVSVVHVRAAVGLDWALSDNILINATPLVIAYSPAIENMDESISSLTRFEMLLGVAYRL